MSLGTAATALALTLLCRLQAAQESTAPPAPAVAAVATNATPGSAAGPTNTAASLLGTAAGLANGPAGTLGSLPAGDAVNVSLGSLTNASTSIASVYDGQTLTNMMAALDDKTKLGAGDKVIYRVIEDQDLPASLIVGDAGDLDVPYYGLVGAAGKTCRQFAAEVKQLLEKQNYFRATVIVGLDVINKKRTVGRVYVMGQVRITGPQDIPDDEVFTVSKAILRAGGFSDFADKKKVRLIRGGGTGAEAEKKTVVINVAEIWEKGKATNDMKLEPDDLVFVPARLVNF